MSTVLVGVLVAFLCVTTVTNTSGCKLCRKENHTVSPQVEVTIYTPKGFSVKISKNLGARHMIFKAILYTASRNIPLTGYCTKTKFDKYNSKWVFENLDETLQVGDIIGYELFVVNKRGNYHKIAEGQFAVRELEQNPYYDETESTTTTEFIPKQIFADTQLYYCHKMMVNTTRTLLSLQTEIETLRETNKMLQDTIQRHVNIKTLNLCGIIPQDGTAEATVLFILWEKLDLKPQVISAVRNNSTCITFAVEAMEEKLEILEEAKKKLHTNRIVIF